MKHWYAGFRTALALTVVTVGVGCSDDEDPMIGDTTGGISGGIVAGTTAGSTTGGTTGGTTAGATTGGTTAGATTGGTTAGATTGGTTAGATTGGTTAGATTGGTTAGATTGGTPDGGLTTGGADAGTGMATGTAPGAGSCGPATTVPAAELGDHTKLGPWAVTREERTGPNGSSWVVYPEELGKDGVKHPVFQWGPGAGTGPNLYEDHLTLLASQGFVVISQSSTQSGREALTWLLAKNDEQGSPWYQKLDPSRVGRGGHSMGALQSMSEADDDRLTMYVLVCGGASGGGGASDIDDPVVFLGGEGLGDTRNFEPDYEEVTGPAVFIRHRDTGHIPCARDNLGPWVAFMRWQFCGETQWQKEFESGGTFCTGAWAECESKNL